MIDLDYLDLLEFGLTACRAAGPDVQLIADYLVEDFEAMQRAHEAISRPDAIEIIEIAAPEPTASPRLAKRRRRIAAEPATAQPVETPARPKTQASPTAASPRPRTAAETPLATRQIIRPETFGAERYPQPAGDDAPADHDLIPNHRAVPR